MNEPSYGRFIDKSLCVVVWHPCAPVVSDLKFLTLGAITLKVDLADRGGVGPDQLKFSAVFNPSFEEFPRPVIKQNVNVTVDSTDPLLLTLSGLPHDEDGSSKRLHPPRFLSRLDKLVFVSTLIQARRDLL